MGIVRFALRFPHTFYVVAALILFLGIAAIFSMPTDIFPEIRIPVVTVIWQYTGLTTPEMEQRVTTYSQYSISANVSGIKNMEAQTLNGLSIQKISFQPDVNLDLAIAQVVSATNSIRALLPPGIQPPIVVQFDASSVPVLQLSLSSDKLNEQQLYDFGIYRVRQQLAPVPGVTLPTPAGGKYRQIMVDIDPDKLLSRGLTPLDIVNAVNTQNLTLPSGTAKIGDTQYTVRTNATPATIDDLNQIPVKFANGATIRLKDVAQVRDGSQVQQNIVRQDGRRSVLLSVIKNGNASTLAVVNGVKHALQSIRAAAPAGLRIKELFDQSVFVTNSVHGVLREGAIAAGLTALMILVFLGSWRSTLVVLISIPLAILSSLVVLYFLGETLNTMTLGGLALAVGILVDDSTVTIENTHRLWTEEGMPLSEATLHGAAEIAVPTLVSTLAISCVFTSVVFLEGPAKYLFTPLGYAVVFAMLASYGLSRTLTPVTIGLLLRGERRHTDGGGRTGLFSRMTAAFDRGFERLRGGYMDVLTTLLRRRAIVPVVAVLIIGLGATMLLLVGRDFFPLIDGGQIQLHVRAPAGTRIESTEKIFQAVEDKIREVIPEKERDLIVDNIGLPARAYNLAFADGSTIGINDGVIQVALKDGHKPTADYVKTLRQVLPAAFPEETFYFQAADMVTQILNFGLPAQIDVRTVGYDKGNLAVAKELRQRLAAIPGIVDAHLQQEVDGPAFFAQIDRTRAASLGLNASTIATNINVSLSSSEQVSPNFWTDPASGIPYYLAVQTPEYKVNSLNALENTPVSASLAASGQTIPGMLSNVATLKRDSIPTNLNQANIQPVYDVYASVQGRDLGSVADEINKVTAQLQKGLKPGNSIQVLGQIQSMNDSFRDLGIGLLFAAVLVYLLMVVNYQTFGDPFVVILALPATLCGIVTMLFITGTTLNVPSLMGAIMAVGVASANSILLVTFAREQQLKGRTAFEAALSAGHTRIRPVLMTAAAMIVGMIPMAIGGAGDEQNAALARAVIGGLLFATPTTLLIVPYLFAMLRKGNDGRPHHGVFEDVSG
ncbi:efflux RND transporter permease subunit [Bradyrhizobium tropiciagri]|uniref:efflux RND transporter permease subunit n=1 Tax=Bradyrhizobium tropiciagri TaxID=312253 RepID=UPI001BA93E19|nr:efflux RND transporter permease subunit [Bradyrhizobium tropiciagri]MBR0870208.1 efflux RND transporter permease subunit [Bradyrhizobium tropiciagri]